MNENGSGNSALLISVTEAAELLGVSRNLAYDLIHDGTLPHVRLGRRRILVSRVALEQWIARESGVDSMPPGMVSSRPQH